MLSLFVACAVLPAVAHADRYGELIAEVAAARKAITNCSIQFRIKEEFRGKASDRLFLIRLDRDRLRADEVPDPKVPPGEQVYARGRKIICRNCPDPGKDTAYVMLMTAVYIVPRGPSVTGAGSLEWLLDPRTIGLTSGGVFDTSARLIDRCLDDPDWIDRRAEPDPTGRRGVWVLHVRHKANGQTRRTWVDTTRGPSVIREETAGIVPNTGGVRHDGLLECDLAQDPVSGVWFPSRIRYTDKRNGDVYLSQDTRFDPVEINRGVDPAVFTLAGFPLPIGWPVVPPGAKRADQGKFWDGAKLVDKSPVKPTDATAALPPEQAPVPVEPPGGWWSRAWPFAAAAAFGVAGLVLIRRAAFAGRSG